MEKSALVTASGSCLSGAGVPAPPSVDRRRLLGGAAALIALAPAARAQSRTAALELDHPDGRRSLYRLSLPPVGRGRWGVILFSHGANSSNADYDRLWDVWTERGYLVIGPNHIDSGPPAAQRKADRSELVHTRLEDTRLPLRRRSVFELVVERSGGALDWGRVAVAGHSFGAVIAQGLAGAHLIDPKTLAAFASPEPAVKACLAFSPPGPMRTLVPEDAWANIRIPALLQTGDADVLPGFVDDWRRRLAGFTPGPDRWTLIGHAVDHYFGGLICRRHPGDGAQSAALNETAEVSADILDAHLRGDRSAGARLAARTQRSDDGIATLTSS